MKLSATNPAIVKMLLKNEKSFFGVNAIVVNPAMQNFAGYKYDFYPIEDDADVERSRLEKIRDRSSSHSIVTLMSLHFHIQKLELDSLDLAHTKLVQNHQNCSFLKSMKLLR